MRYLAKSEPARAKRPLFLFLLIGLVCFFAARVTPYLRWMFDIGTIVSMSGIGYLLLRYVFTSFEYETAEESFMVYRLLGKNRDLVFSAEREIIEKIVKYGSIDLHSGKKKPPIHQLYPSYGKESVWVMVIQGENNSPAWVYLQCGEEFAAHLEKWMLKQA